MKLLLFNPEHDIALAHNDPYFTAPRAGRQLRSDLAFLPVLWAEEGDVVLVDDIEAAEKHIRHYGIGVFSGCCVTLSQLGRLPITEVEPWGWDRTIRHQLLRAGVSSDVLPMNTNWI